ncbi:DUF4236 domain-containing protein [bacterium]|nr:DUF4236 domain-containing protein [bacterium]
MGFRFRRSITVVKGVRINLSTTGASLSVGPKGSTINIGKRGVRTTQDLPGSGGYYTDEHSWGEIGSVLGGKGKKSAGPSPGRQPSGRAAHPARGRKAPAVQGAVITSRVGKGEVGEDANPLYIAPGVRLELGFLQRLSAPAQDEALLDGLKLLLSEDQRAAFEKFIQATASPDGCFMAGICALQFGIYTDAVGHLSNALKRSGELGATLRAYRVDCWVSFQLSGEIIAYVRCDVYGAMLALAEAQQRLGNLDDARATLRELLRHAPGDILARLSLAELIADEELEDEAAAQELAALGAGVENESELHCALLLYQGRALARLSMFDGAKAALTSALSKRKDRDKELLRAIRYERALVHEAMGERKAAKADLERIYSEDPDYEDVALRLEKPAPAPKSRLL